jgi:hypothetical protein
VKFWKWFFLLLGPLLLGAFVGMMLTVIYPRSMQAAAYLCPEDKPDSFVISYTTTTSDGTGTSFTLYCMSERGEVYELGTWRPMVVVMGITIAVAYGIVLLFVIWGLIKRLLRRSDPDTGVPTGAPPPEFGDPPPSFSA